MTYAMGIVVQAALNLPETDRHYLRVIDLEAVATRFSPLRRHEVAADLARIARERRGSRE